MGRFPKEIPVPRNYRAAEVQVVWHIFSQFEEVDVYSGTRLDTMVVCRGDKICSAASVIPDFQLSAQAVFAKPVKPL